MSGAGQPGQSKESHGGVLPTRYFTSESSSMGSSSSLEVPGAVVWGGGSGLLKSNTYYDTELKIMNAMTILKRDKIINNLKIKA